VVVQDEGRRVAARYLTVLGRPNALGCDRLGIIASRKLGDAVVRNRAKRRLREVFRQLEPDLSAARGFRTLDLVIVPRRESLTAPLSALAAEFSSSLRRLRSTHG
jgi:ribonuclease P protein component